jgi:hypothetical protein
MGKSRLSETSNQWFIAKCKIILEAGPTAVLRLAVVRRNPLTGAGKKEIKRGNNNSGHIV